MSSKTATSKDTILGRIRQGQRFVNRGWSERDRLACKRFLDGSENSAYLLYDDMDDTNDGAGVVPEIQEVGNVNYLATNILTKVASIAIGDPDYHVNCGEDNPEKAEVVRQFLHELWKVKNWQRHTNKALLKRSLSGMACIAYLWNDRKGPVIEHVPAKDLAIDPNTTDWRDVRWAARQVRIPKEEAAERWPAFTNNFELPAKDIKTLDETVSSTKFSVKVWCYWDQDIECVFYGDEELERGENLYGRVPLCFLEGDIAPESPFSLGDYDIATGLQEQLARFQSMINSQAENGGAIGWYNPSMLDDASKDAFSDGRPQEFIAIKSPSPESVFGYVRGEPMSECLLEAWRMCQQGLDGVTGVTQYQRGVVANPAKFATEAAMLQNQSGARGNKARVEYEQFLDLIALRVIEMSRKFAPTLMLDQNPNDQVLLDALNAVQDVCVLESSTTYKDPAQEIQAALQLLQAMNPYIEAGLVDPVPLIQDVFRAFGKRDVSKYMRQQTPGVGMPGAAPVPPGGPGASAGLPAGNPAPMPARN